MKKNFDDEYPYPVAGIDEAGRGPLAGPVVAACVILEHSKLCPKIFANINDSKKISNKKRFEIYQKLIELKYTGIGIVEAKIIDKINILQATKLAMKLAFEDLMKKKFVPKIVLVDGNFIPEINCPAKSIIKGDTKSKSIAAASIIAKQERDNFMLKMHQEYPQYKWDKNKGYGTKSHLENIKKYGICALHRKSFKPVAMFNIFQENSSTIDHAIEALCSGKIIIFATDTVYAIACDASNNAAIKKIYDLKNRNHNKPLAILSSGIDSIEKIAHIKKKERMILTQNSSRAITLILKKRLPTPLLDNIGNESTIAVRIPNTKFCSALLSKFKGIIAATSCNISNQKDITSFAEVRKYFGNKVVMLIDGGDCKLKKSSTIAKVVGDKIEILRKGSLSTSKLEEMEKFMLK